MLVIFDFDGTLVDSEIIWAKATLEIFRQEGLEMDLDEYNGAFAGMTNEEIIDQVREDYDQPLSPDVLQRVEDLAMRGMDDLKMIDGAHDVLDQLDYARCICSNSTTEKLETNMRLTGLWDRFRPYVYSAVEVGNKAPKPDPNVFLHAATALEMEPSQCFVLEDSTHGAHAARQAGMRVIGFIGASHTYPGHGEHLMDSGAETVIRRLIELPAVLEALKNWQEA